MFSAVSLCEAGATTVSMSIVNILQIKVTMKLFGQSVLKGNWFKATELS